MTESNNDEQRTTREDTTAKTTQGGSEAAPSQPEPAAATAGYGVGRGLAIGALVVSVLALIIVLVGGWWGWQRYQAFAAGQGELVRDAQLTEQTGALGERIAKLQGRVTSLDKRTGGRDQAIADLRERIDSVKQAQSDNSERMDRIAEMAKMSRNDWRRSEAAYLADVAIYRLRYYQDVDSALGALKEADKLLSALGGESIEARKAVSKAIDRLLAANLPKVGEISTALTRMARNLDSYALRSGAQPVQGGDDKSDDGSDTNTLPITGAAGRVWQSLSNAMSKLVVVSGPEREVVPLRPAKQRFFLRQNLSLQLYTARLAALQGRTDVYRNALGRAREWLKRFFDVNDPAVAKARKRLAALAKHPITADLPEIADVLAPARQFQSRGSDDT